MYPFKRILVPTDFSLCAEAAFRHALFLAQHYTAEVHLVHIVTSNAALQIPSHNGTQEEKHWPDKATAPQPGKPAYTEHWHDVLLHRVVVPHTDPVAAILDYAHRHDIDLIVMGAHGDRGVGHYLSFGTTRTFLGHTAEQVIRHATCTVFRVGLRSGQRAGVVRRILVPIDMSSLSLLGLAYAKDLAALYKAPLDLLHVIEQGVQQGKLHNVQETSARADLMTLCRKTKGPDVSVRFHVVWGRPARAIRTFAQCHGIDLIVMGAHSDLGKDTLGIVAERIVHTASCAVYTVRNGEKNDTDVSKPFRGVWSLSTIV